MASLHLSRRSVLAALAACGAGAATGCRPNRSGGTSLSELADERSGPVAPSAHRLATRLTFGPSVAVLALAERGAEAFLADQLAPTPGTDGAAELLAAIETRGQRILGDESTGGDAAATRRRAAVETLVLRTVVGAAWSDRQLHALLTDFWSDHLHVTVREQPELFWAPSYDLDVIRAQATGSFAELLVASARSAAMLVFLDQAASRADGANVPNENYARELMELHTVGVDGGYDELDVAEAAHVLSGWSMRRRTGEFVFRPEHHDLGPLGRGGDVLGFEPGGDGVADGEDFLHHLARLPATARHVCHRLAIRLVGDEVAPDDQVVVDAAEAFRSADTSIAAAVRTIVTSTAFATAPPVPRRPFDQVVAMLRMGCRPPAAADLDRLVRPVGAVLSQLGHAPYGWPAPNGAPLQGGAWVGPGAMVSRWNAAIVGAAGFGVLEADEGTAHADGDAVGAASQLLGRPPSDPLRAALATAASALPPAAPAAARSQLARTLVFASPDFQER